MKQIAAFVMSSAAVGLILTSTSPTQAQENADAAPSGPKLLMLPYQPIFRSVEQAKAQQATEYLHKVLKDKDDLAVVRGGIAEKPASPPSLNEAQQAQKTAEAAEAARNMTDAITARKAVIASLEKNASAIDDVKTFVQAHLYLARAQMWAGNDDDAKTTLAAAARMTPDYPIKPQAFSRLFRRWYKEAAEQVLKEAPGELLVKSVLPGAKIFLDGREMDIAPVRLQKAVPGKHLLGAEVEGVPRYQTVVTIEAGKKTDFRVSFGGTVGGEQVGEVTDAIATNTMNASAVEAAVKAGQAVSAAYVVAGGMSKAEDHFKMHTFVVNVSGKQVQALDVVKFDLDLLTAEADVIRIVRSIEAAMKKFDAPKPMIAMIDRQVREATTVNAVDAQPNATGPKNPRATKKRGPRKVFRVLKGAKLKDE